MPLRLKYNQILTIQISKEYLSYYITNKYLTNI